MSDVALDTSAAIAFLVRTHTAHAIVRSHVGRRRARLTGHSLAETYSVLTRLPGDARLAPDDAVTLIEANFVEPVSLDAKTASSIHAVLAAVGIAGGAVYDALVALAARQSDLPLATRDQRAATTYLALQARVEMISS